MTTHKILPNANFIEQLEQDIAHAKKMIVKKVNILIALILLLVLLLSLNRCFVYYVYCWTCVRQVHLLSCVI